MNAINEDVFWLAGILEGEGYFAVSHDKRPGRRPRLVVSVDMVDKDVVDVVANLMQGTVRACAPRPDKENNQPIFRTTVTGQKAENVMRAVLPHMGLRRSARITECLATPNLSHTPRKGDLLS